jgi:hypothetical protein
VLFISRIQVYISVDTVIKGREIAGFWGADTDQVFFCTPPPDTGCYGYTLDDYRRYSEILNKPFIMFADSLYDLRRTSVSPWHCRGDEGNYISGDSIFSDYPYKYPQVSISLMQFFTALNQHSSIRLQMPHPEYHFASVRQKVESGNGIYDIRGRLIGFSENGFINTKYHPIVYIIKSLSASENRPKFCVVK